MVHLHLHTSRGSLLDSILEIDEATNFAKENNQEAIALTDHGTMFSYVDFYKSCKKNNIKPIIGCEVYEVDDMNLKSDSKDNKQQRYHLILLVKNQKGLTNLYKLVSESYLKGFYTKPRIDLDYIQDNNLGEGIICLTACMAGRFSRIIEGKENKYTKEEYVNRLNKIFDYVALEIQSHPSELQLELNSKIVGFANRNDIPYVVTTDAHMLNKSQLDTHSIFVQIGSSREVGESYNGCYLQTDDEIHEYLDNTLGEDIVNKAIKETHNITSMIEEIDIGLNNGNLMPKIDCPKEFKDNFEYFNHIINSNFDKKFNYLNEKEKKIRRERLNMEIPILKQLEYIDYFLMLLMLTKEAKKRGIPLGYSRGSGANCLTLFVLGVTQIDSVRWNLDFSRFANLGRKSMADYDMDISQARRREMVTISEDLFGKEKVAPICTFNMLSTKVAIKDIGKVLDEKGIYKIPYNIRDEVSKLIPTIKTLNDLGEEEEKETLLRDVLLVNPRLKEINELYPLWFKYVMELEGKPKSLGRHACGTLIFPRRLDSYCPLCLDTDGNQMVQLEMHNAMDDLGMCKMDFLGLKNLDIIDECLKKSNLTWEDVDINHIDLNDKKVFDYVYKHGNTIGVFQMESAEAVKLCIEAETDNVEDVIAINAFNRPGTKAGFPTYVQNKKFPEKATILHDDLRDIFKATHLVLLYQEQALQLFRLAGFPEDAVDNARRSIGKKQKKVMESLKVDFSKGLKNRGWNDNQINEIWLLMLKQAEYSFNRGHSVAYGLLSYLTAYLKTYHPIEFMTACLNVEFGNTGKTGILINECNRLNIQVCPPNINKSMSYYTPIDNKILYGLNPIKGVGKEASNYIIKNRPYNNLNDFLDKVICSESCVNKTAIISLIKSGAIPTKNKNNTLKKYAEYIYKESEFKPVKTLPTKKKLYEDWGINTDLYNDKEDILIEYNKRKEIKFNEEKMNKKKKYLNEFKEKYVSNPDMYEFETLSMFLTTNPFKEISDELLTKFSDVENKYDCVILSSIIDIKRKKDKRNNQFAYVDLYTCEGVIEGICWASCYNKYQQLIKKGNHLAMLGEKQDDKLIIKKIKTFEQWLEDIKHK